MCKQVFVVPQSSERPSPLAVAGFAETDDETHEFCSKVLRTQPSISRLNTEFKVERTEMGSGNFSKVFRAKHRLDGNSYAIKRTKQSITSDQDRNRWLQASQPAPPATATHATVA